MKELTNHRLDEITIGNPVTRWFERPELLRDFAREIIAADRALNAPADWDAMRQVPDGWMLVPKNPDLDQYNAACRAYVDWQAKCQEEARAHENEPSESWFYSQPHFTHTDVYIAMLAAAPTPKKS